MQVGSVPAKVAVTEVQMALVRVAVAMHDRAMEWPTASALADAAGISFTVVWQQLCRLARLGVIDWRQTVRVVRVPDGIVAVVRAAS